MDQPSAGFDATDVITDMDVAMDSGGRASVIIGTWDGAGIDGEVYAYVPATTGLGWQRQSLGATWIAADVLAVAFSPNFADDEGIFAVTQSADEANIQAAFGYTKDGGGWGLSIGPGEFYNREGASLNGTATSAVTRARVGFPEDFDVDSITSNVAFVGITAGTSNGMNQIAAGGEMGDVFKVVFQPTASTTEDMNVRGLISALARRPTSTPLMSPAMPLRPPLSLARTSGPSLSRATTGCHTTALTAALPGLQRGRSSPPAATPMRLTVPLPLVRPRLRC
jgi:hypothetical protein